jgi:general secretion pathway protein D
MLLAMAGGLEARSRKGDKFFKDAKNAEVRKEWDKALELYEKALGEDPGEISYQMGMRRARFQSGQAHVDLGQKARINGDLDQALAEFQKAYAIDPSSAIAEQELKRTLEMIERNKKGGAAIGPSESPLTPAELARKRETDQIRRIEGPPELRPLQRQPVNLRMSNQPKVLFETIAKLAGVNVVFDPDYKNDPNASKSVNVELVNSSLEDALDYLGLMSKSFWKPLSANTIFVTNDTQQKRRDYEDSVVRVFYLTNLTTPQEIQEITTTLRTIANIRKVFQYNSLNAIIVRGSPDEVALASKLVNDLDKPKAEVVVDVLVMEASRSLTRNLGATLATSGSAGINTGIGFTPRNPVLQGTSGSTGDTGSTTSSLISLARIAKVSTNDFSVTLPGALIQAVITDSSTRILQSPQVRAASGQKATLRIGDRVPIASGGVQPFGGTSTGFSSLYSQFQFVDVGVNVDITPTVHGENEVTLKAVLEISSVRDRVEIAGVSQPIIGQRKVEHEIRIREGEVSLLGGLMQDQYTKSTAGIPGLVNIPGLKYLFGTQSINPSSQQELLIALIPHIVRTPGITDLNLKPVEAGNDQYTRLNYARVEAPAPPGEVKPPVAPPGVAPAPAATPSAKAEPPPPAAPQGGPRLYFQPSLVQTQAGAAFTIQLVAENVADLFAAPFHLKFDPQMLRLNEVKAGTLLSGGGQDIIFTRNILNDSGDATVNLNRMPGSGGASGTGPLVTFTFQAVKAGTSAIQFTELSLRNSQLQPVQAASPQAAVAVK